MARPRRALNRIPIRGTREQELMRRAGRVVALALVKISEALRPGITTGELNDIAEKTIRGLGAIPAFLGYNGFPASACISLNDEVVHGIPGDLVVRDGDVVSVDLGAIVDGWYGDAARTFAVGTVTEDARRLMEAGEGALAVGIAAARGGNRVRDIGAAIEAYTQARGYSVVRDLCGHGIGQRLHEDPKVPNYATRGGDMVLRPGMTLAIEPMVNAGRAEVELMPDGWTFVTADGTLSVHYEHTVLIRQDEPEILTALR